MPAMEIIGIEILIKELEEIKVCIGITRFFIGNTFISNARLKLAKNHAKAKKHADFGYLKIIRFLIPVITQK